MPKIARYMPLDEVQPVRCPKDNSAMKYHPMAGAWKCTKPGCRMRARSEDSDAAPVEPVIGVHEKKVDDPSVQLQVMGHDVDFYAVVRRQGEKDSHTLSLRQYVTDTYFNGESGNYADLIVTIEIPAYVIEKAVE